MWAPVDLQDKIDQPEKRKLYKNSRVLMINKKLTAKQKEENHFGKSFVRICCFFRLI